MTRRRYVAVAFTAALITTSCASSDSEADVAADCTPIEDDYGFVIEVCTEDGDSSSSGQQSELTELVLAIPDATVAERVGATLRAMSEVVGECESFAELQASSAEVIERLDSAIEAVKTSTELGDWIRGETAKQLADSMEQQFGTELRCRVPDPDEGLQLTSSITGALDRWRSATVPRFEGVGSSMWMNSDQLGHTLMVQDVLARTGSIDVVVIGDSITKRGIDPGALGQSLGATAVNVGMDGAVIGQYEQWFEELRGLGASPQIVVLAVSSQTAAIPCGDLRPALHEEAAANRAIAFSQLEGLSETDPARRASGGTTGTYRSPLLDRYEEIFEPGSNGLYQGAQEPPPDRLEAMRETYAAVLTNPPCAQWPEDLRATIEAVEAAGATPVVVSVPQSPELNSLHPESLGGPAAYLGPFAAVAGEAGVEFLEFSGLLAEDDFADLVHPNLVGRDRWTEALAAGLAP